MSKDKKAYWKDHQEKKNMKMGSVSGGVYGLAFVGAAVYFIQHATTFGTGALGVLKAIVWPALLVYKLLEFFKM